VKVVEIKSNKHTKTHYSPIPKISIGTILRDYKFFENLGALSMAFIWPRVDILVRTNKTRTVASSYTFSGSQTMASLWGAGGGGPPGWHHRGGWHHNESL